MNASLRIAVAAATGTALISGSQLISPIARADDELHNVTYIVQFDGAAPGTVATFMLTDNQTNSADLDVPAFKPFEARAQLANPAKAGMQLRLRWPAATTVHCEIQVDDIVAVKSARYVDTWWKDPSNPRNGVMQCGAPLSGVA
jgi:hypothetical protein